MVNVTVWPKKLAPTVCSTSKEYFPSLTTAVATMIPFIQADTRTPSAAKSQSRDLVALGVVNGVAVAVATLVGVGAGAVLKLPPVWMVILVGSGVGETLGTP